MKKLQSQHYILLVLSLLALCAAITAYVFMYKDVLREATEEAVVKADVSAASKQALEAKNLEETYENTAADRALLPSFLVSENDAVPFIDAVEAVGPATGATISISSLSSGTGGSSNQVVTATISAAGTWPDVMRAVQMVENMPYAISVTGLNLDLLSSDNASPKSAPQWTAAVDISVLSS